MLTELSEWKSLKTHCETILSKISLKDEFEKDQNRFDKFCKKFSFEKDFIMLDFSKNLITDETLKLLFNLAKACNLEKCRTDMFKGVAINSTEKRAVLHVALRMPEDGSIMVDGKNVVPDVHQALSKMRVFVNSVHEGKYLGCSGKKFTDVVNIGIGGSDLGPLMVTEALKPYSRDGLKAHFVSNIDGTHLSEVTLKLNPETTLFVISSKTFTTIETMTNARSSLAWFKTQLSKNMSKTLQPDDEREAISKHFVAVSTNTKLVEEFGINKHNMFGFWDWVGGRYSLWSSIGLSIALNIGMKNFEDLLHGAHLMDEHFLNAPMESNLPVLLGLMGILYYNFLDYHSHAILPYDQYMHRFAAYFQQGDMESNGKSVTKDGKQVTYHTGPVIWGEPGTNGQHAFYQLLHQGTQKVMCDFLCPLISHNPIDNNKHHTLLFANFIAQTEALMKGKTPDEVKKELSSLPSNDVEALLLHKSFSGNRPSNSIVFKKLNAVTLGALIALYEHKIFVQGTIWNINSFDQFGVELGKKLATDIYEELHQKKVTLKHDCSTESLIKLFISEASSSASS